MDDEWTWARRQACRRVEMRAVGRVRAILEDPAERLARLARITAAWRRLALAIAAHHHSAWLISLRRWVLHGYAPTTPRAGPGHQ